MKLNTAKLEHRPGKIFEVDKEGYLDFLDYKGMSLKLDSSLQLEGEAFFKNHTVYLSAETKARIIRRCSRCLKEMVVEVIRRDDIEFKKGEPEGERLSAEWFVYGYSGEKIPLLPLLSSLIVSSLDPKPLCKPDCAGVCPRCGADLNQGECSCEEEKTVDPRLEKLKELL